METAKTMTTHGTHFENFFPFARPTLDDHEIEEVVSCLKSDWLTTGPRVKAFEEKLKAYHQAEHVVCVSSATAGLHLSLLALDLQPGDEVITTPMTFVATVNTIIHAGGTPVFVDIDPETLNLDTQQLEAAITPRTRAIMPVHFAGLPVDLDIYLELQEKRGIRLVEDAAHASGAFYKGKPIGSFNDICVLSFHPNKNMTTGEGGAVLTNDPAIADRIKKLTFHGIDREAWNRFGKTGQQGYDVLLPGFKYNMMDIQAAIGLHQIDKLDTFVKHRQALAAVYEEGLTNHPYCRIMGKPDYDYVHARHLFQIVLRENSPLTRDELMNALKERNVGTGLHYQSCSDFDYIKKQVPLPPQGLPISHYVGQNIISLPLHPRMEAEQAHKVIDILNEILKVSP